MRETIRPAPYQLVALSKLLLGSLHSILIADGVGVGKTITAGYIASWTLCKKAGDVLVVCPAGLLEKWRLELKLKFGLTARMIRSLEEYRTAKSEKRLDPQPAVYLLPSSRLAIMDDFDCATLIVDEIHNFRNEDTLGWKAIHRIAQQSSNRIGLSATPINNSIEDLGNIFALLLPSFDALAIQAVISDLWLSHDYGLLSPILTRFVKEQLGIHFATRRLVDIRVRYPVKYVRDTRETVESVLGRTVGLGKYPLEAITYFREAASSPQSFDASTGAKLEVRPDPKVESLRKVLSDLGRRALVFCQFTQTVDYLASSLREFRSYQMTGETPVADRESIINAFRRDEGSILILTQVGSEGLDLQFCDAVINYDLHWNPMIMEQRAGRIDRIGQKKPEITVFTYRVDGSIDERVWGTVQRKLGLISGSPLAPTLKADAPEPMFSNSSILAEEEAARRMVDSLALSNRIILDDDGLVQSIGTEACNPDLLGGMAPLDWVKKEHPGWVKWAGEFSTSEERLMEKLARYDQVVKH